MKRMAALMGVLLLMTLALAAPAAANQKVVLIDEEHGTGFELLVDLDNPEWFWDWECTGPPITWGVTDATHHLWFWYPNNVAPDARFPVDRAWPWTTGKYAYWVLNYFSELPEKGGLVLEGRSHETIDYSHHVLGSVGWDPDPETWIEKSAGETWGLRVPGHGPILHFAGGASYLATVRLHADGVYADYSLIRAFRGHWTMDAEALCAYFGRGVTYR